MPNPLLATPAIWFPGQTDQEWQAEVDALFERAYITAAFMRGEVEVDSFLDYLDENYVDPFVVAESWDEELCSILI